MKGGSIARLAVYLYPRITASTMWQYIGVNSPNARWSQGFQDRPVLVSCTPSSLRRAVLDRVHDTEGKIDPTTLTQEQLFYLHCRPRMDDIRDKVATVRRAHPELEDVYTGRNGGSET